MNPLTVIFMDCGQGDSTLIVFPNKKIMLVDCGSIKNSSEVLPEIKKVVEDTFNLVNRKVIDQIVITHPDQDHYNMLVPLIAKTSPTVGSVIYGGHIDQYENKSRGERNRTRDWLKKLKKRGKAQPAPLGYWGGSKPWFTEGGVDVYMLAANCTGDSKADANDNSIVLLLHYGDHKVFLMGDATEKTEQFILKGFNNKYDLLKFEHATSLKMGHHGSNTSSCREWIQTLTPSALIISSDTRSFGRNGAGLPPSSFLKSVQAWSSNVGLLNLSRGHHYVDWEDNRQSKDFGRFLARDAQKRAICSTLYEIEYAQNGWMFEATGGSWYWKMKADGELIVEWTGA